MILKIVHKKKFLKLVLMFVLFCHMIFPVSGNNVRLNGTVKVTDVTFGVATLELDLSWDNSWRDEFNWDAVWIFVKYRSTSGNWSHVLLQETGHSASNGYQIMTGKSGSDVVGVFVYPGTEGVVRQASTKLTLKWLCGSGFTKSSFDNNEVFLLGQGIEMVYVPYGAYYAGDGYSGNCLSDAEGAPLVIDSEDTRTFYQRGEDNSVTTVINNLSANYPKGYSGYYVMKYELSQEQYVRFLNTLTKSEQESLLGASFLSSLRPGRFIFGDTLQPSFRNGIVLRSKPEGRPYVFGHDLNDNGVYDENGDGQCVACNYLSLNDLLGYASWCGLRPMSELEYERSCRSSFPQVPVKGEYVWNTSGDVSSVTSLLSSGKETEVAGVASNVNSHNSLGSRRGPVRCGAFAGESTTQVESGGTYWGVMEMGGNVGELVANLRNTTLDKMVNGSGSFSLSTWSTSPVHYGVRGGSFAGTDSLLRSSDRSEITGYVKSVADRDSSVGIRLTRSLDAGLVTVNPGTISLTGPLCPGVESIIGETVAASVGGISGDFPLSYIWSYSTNNGVSWDILPNETGKTLSYSDFETGEKYLFRRKVLCALGEATTQTQESSSVPNLFFTVFPATVYLDQANAASCLFTVQNVAESGGMFSWMYAGSVIDDSPNGDVNLMSSGSVYRPSRNHYGNAETVSGVLPVVCRHTLNGCSADVEVDVVVSPYVSDPCYGQTTVTDTEGNRYNIVKIGAQCWMQQDLNVGTMSNIVSSDYWMYKKPDVQKWCSNNDEQNCNKYGGLYEWWEVVCNGYCPDLMTPDMTIDQDTFLTMELAVKAKVPGVKMAQDGYRIQGLCPDGWHLPTDEEWKQLEMYLGMSRSSADKAYPQSDGDGWGRQTGSPGQGKMMKSQEDNWNGLSVPNDPDPKYRFYGRPHGYRRPSGSGFYNLGAQALWWSSTVVGTLAWDRELFVPRTSVARDDLDRSYGFSVRCIRD